MAGKIKPDRLIMELVGVDLAFKLARQFRYAIPMLLSEISWNYILSNRHRFDDRSPAEVEATERCMLYLRSVFGEDLALFAPRLLSQLFNTAPWTYQWIDWFADSLVRLERATGYESLRKRLTSRITFGEACSVLHVAERMDFVGLHPSFDVPATVGERTRVPDLFLEDTATGARFYCEVSVMFSAKKMVDAADAFDRISRPLHAALIQNANPYVYAGRILRPVSEEEIDGLHNRIWWEILEARKDESFREIVEGNVLVFALAPVAQQDLVIAWAKAHGLDPSSFGGVMPVVDQASRLRQKIEEKVEQLPEGRPNLLVIPAQDLFIPVWDPKRILPLTAEILSGFPKVAMLILSGEGYALAPAGSSVVGEHLIVTSNRGGLSHQYLGVLNASCSTTLPPTTHKLIQAALAL